MGVQNVCHVNSEFTQHLLNDVNSMIAKTTYKHLQNDQYGFALKLNTNGLNQLIQFKKILEQLLNCNDCLQLAYNSDEIIYAIKNKVNELR